MRVRLLSVGRWRYTATARAVHGVLLKPSPRAIDLTTYFAVIVLVFAVVTAASWLPAHRAAGIDPLLLLRRE